MRGIRVASLKQKYHQMACFANLRDKKFYLLPLSYNQHVFLATHRAYNNVVDVQELLSFVV